ncbi:FMN-binding protein [Amycolatopsis sp. cmx-4-68]|uniref:FMN-binding protein n=1 Tax=Amycolatopsis sp. cmx-4-68 TaxID=2790938 RepID=UPI00397CBA94
MRRIVVTAAATISVVVLLFSYRTSTDPAPAALPSQRIGAQGPLGGPTTPSASPTPAPTAGTSGGDGTYTGDAVDTRYGPVQVQITVTGGRITAAQAVQVPQESSRDVRINSAAVPVLVDETLQAQSAQVDTVSGATYTSEGYQQSLQSAIDAAHR